MEKKIGIIDIGSNTIRLVIYQVINSYYKEMKNIKVSARLQTFLNNEMILTNDGIQKLVETLTIFKEILMIHQVSNVKVVATATIRQSKNQEEIKKHINSIGFEVDILTGEEEAYFGFLSVVNSTSLQSGISIDIGGGSTEITKFVNRKMVNSISLPFGVLSLNKMFPNETGLPHSNLEDISNFISNRFKNINWLQNSRLPIIGLGGSARNFGQIDQSMYDYPLKSVHLYDTDIKNMIEVYEELKSYSHQSLLQIEGLSKERTDIIMPAIQVFINLANVVNAPFFQISKKGIREGILIKEMDQPTTDSLSLNRLIEKSLIGIGIAYFIDMGNRAFVTNTVNMIAESLQKQKIGNIYADDIKFLKLASYVFNIGEFIENESSSEHTFYLLSNQSIDGLSHYERIKIALLASYKSKKDYKNYIKPYKDWFSKDESQKIRLLGAILKFSYLLNHTNRNIIKSINILRKKEEIDFEIYCDKVWSVEQHLAEKQIKHLEKVLNSKVYLHFLPHK